LFRVIKATSFFCFVESTNKFFSKEVYEEERESSQEEKHVLVAAGEVEEEGKEVTKNFIKFSFL